MRFEIGLLRCRRFRLVRNGYFLGGRTNRFLPYGNQAVALESCAAQAEARTLRENLLQFAVLIAASSQLSANCACVGIQLHALLFEGVRKLFITHLHSFICIVWQLLLFVKYSFAS